MLLSSTSKFLVVLIGLAIWYLFDGTTTIAYAATKQKTKVNIERYKSLCNAKPMVTKKHTQAITWMVDNVGDTFLTFASSPQHEAACWILREMDEKKKSFSAQRYILAIFYYATKGASWDRNDHWLATNKHECSWFGVICKENPFSKVVVGLDLGFIKVDGIVPRELGLLPELKDLDLHGNDLQGVIPHKLFAQLTKLEYFRIHMNGMFGAIPAEIKNMVHLKELYLFGNYVGGTIPKELATLKNLEVLDLYANQLEGTIPKELAKLPKLRFLDLHDNNLVGTMPKEICDRRLDTLIADCYGRNPEVKCDCCTICCQGLPVMSCVDTKTGKPTLPV